MKTKNTIQKIQFIKFGIGVVAGVIIYLVLNLFL